MWWKKKTRFIRETAMCGASHDSPGRLRFHEGDLELIAMIYAANIAQLAIKVRNIKAKLL